MLAKRELQSLKLWFESTAIEETISKHSMRSVIGEVFVRKVLAGICLRACEESPSALSRKETSHEPVNSCSEVIPTLLQSSEYEVRLAVLDFIISHLPSDVNTSLDCEVALQKNPLNSREDSWIFRTLELQVKSQLFTMAMGAEHHADCLVKVTKYSSESKKFS